MSLREMKASLQRATDARNSWSLTEFREIMARLEEALVKDAEERGVKPDPDACRISIAMGVDEDGLPQPWLVAANETGEEVAAENLSTRCPPDCE